jgi:hypothetical protein
MRPCFGASDNMAVCAYAADLLAVVELHLWFTRMDAHMSEG